MSENTGISWTDFTYNPWYGCKKSERGMRYMFRDMAQYGMNPNIIAKSKTKFKEPLKFKSSPGKDKVFTCSWSDFFIEEADEWRPDVWEIIRQTPHLQYQILTKRPERVLNNLPPYFEKFQNVWIGVSCEDQETWDLRVYDLAKIVAFYPNAITFVSCEPLLGPIKLEAEAAKFVNWVIIGGESGNNIGKFQYRDCDLDWIRRLYQDCRRQRVPVFIKQLGNSIAREHQLKSKTGKEFDEIVKFFPDPWQFPVEYLVNFI